MLSLARLLVGTGDGGNVGGARYLCAFVLDLNCFSTGCLTADAGGFEETFEESVKQHFWRSDRKPHFCLLVARNCHIFSQQDYTILLISALVWSINHLVGSAVLV